MNRALFLDRDGIFNKVVFRNESMHSPNNWDEVVHETGLEILKEIKAKGFKLIMVTNQPDIERGIVSEAFVNDVNEFYRKQYDLDGVYCCPFSSNEHPDKKPNPGMILRAAKEHNIDLKNSYFLGDTEKDLEAASAAGCRFILYRRPYNSHVKSETIIAQFADLKPLK